MTINKKQNGESLVIELEGRLDTTTAPQLEVSLKESMDGVTNLVFDLSSLEYISSAGLRVLLYAQKVMDVQGKMTVKGVNKAIMDIFEVTQFIAVLNIE